MLPDLISQKTLNWVYEPVFEIVNVPSEYCGEVILAVWGVGVTVPPPPPCVVKNPST